MWFLENWHANKSAPSTVRLDCHDERSEHLLFTTKRPFGLPQHYANIITAAVKTCFPPATTPAHPGVVVVPPRCQSTGQRS